jgi:endonuclease/exonuclease/phosphatase family metal-dependent hydrolase
MKPGFKAFLFLVFSAVTTLGQDPIHAISFNIRYDNPLDGPHAWSERKESLAHYLTASHAQICCLQECLYNQVLFLDSALTSFQRVGVGREDGINRGEFAPIYFDTSRFYLLSSYTTWLSETPDVPSKGWDAACERLVNVALLWDNNNQQPLVILNTHWDHVGVQARAHSADIILNLIAELEYYPYRIVCGDFNATAQDSSIIKLTQSGLEDAASHPELGTFNAFETHPKICPRIDYFLVNDAVAIQEYSVDHPLTSSQLPLSDHYPVHLTFNMTAPPEDLVYFLEQDEQHILPLYSSNNAKSASLINTQFQYSYLQHHLLQCRNSPFKFVFNDTLNQGLTYLGGDLLFADSIQLSFQFAWEYSLFNLHHGLDVCWYDKIHQHQITWTDLILPTHQLDFQRHLQREIAALFPSVFINPSPAKEDDMYYIIPGQADPLDGFRNPQLRYYNEQLELNMYSISALPYFIQDSSSWQDFLPLNMDTVRPWLTPYAHHILYAEGPLPPPCPWYELIYQPVDTDTLALIFLPAYRTQDELHLSGFIWDKKSNRFLPWENAALERNQTGEFISTEIKENNNSSRILIQRDPKDNTLQFLMEPLGSLPAKWKALSTP